MLDAAETGDDVARGIVRAHGRRVAGCILAAARQVGMSPEPSPLVLAGGVFRHRYRLLGETIFNLGSAQSPGVAAIYSACEPVLGAVLLALQMAHIPMSCLVRDRWQTTSPPLSFFQTEGQ